MNLSFPRPDRTVLKTLLVLLGLFLLSSFSLFLGYLLKKVDPAEYGLIHGQKEDLEITYKEILFFGSIMIAFFVLSLAYRHVQRALLKKILVGLAVFYLSLAAVMILADSIHYLIFASRINFPAIQTILNTNPSEASDFIKMYSSPGVLLALLIFAAVIVLIVFTRRWFEKLFSTFFFFVITLILSAVSVIDFIQMAHSKGNGLHNMRYWDIVIGEYNEYMEFNRRLVKEKTRNLYSEEYSGFYRQDTASRTVVLVISESLSKKHMSLYGYKRPTTPRLDNNTDLIVFNDCVTQAALTIEAVPGLFFNGYLSKKVNLITILNKLGYETSWLSNQSGWGKSDKTIVLLSELCKTNYFTDNRADDGLANTTSHYDEELLKPFEKQLRSGKNRSKFIVLHLMGCHFDYDKRYPGKRSVFHDDPPVKAAGDQRRSFTTINSYDNAMHYHDSVMNQVIRIFRTNTTGQNAALMFLSDHGEELFENRDHAGHGYPPTRSSAEIPCFMLLSEGFRHNYPEMTQTIISRKNSAYSSSNNFYTLLHFMGIQNIKHKEKLKHNAFFSPFYNSGQPRLVMGIDYRDLSK